MANDRLTLSLNSRVTGAAMSVPLHVLPGDADLGGSVLAGDLSEVKRKFFNTTAHPGAGPAAYSVFHDLNGDGSILADDFSEVKARLFDRLPAAAL